jgi:hypothetical protein
MLAGHLDMAEWSEVAFIGVALLVASRTLEVPIQFLSCTGDLCMGISKTTENQHFG